MTWRSTAASASGIGCQPERERDERLVDRVEHAVIGRSTGGGATQMADLDVQERRSDERLDHPVDGGRGQIRRAGSPRPSRAAGRPGPC